jgi:hypothetical protein
MHRCTIKSPKPRPVARFVYGQDTRVQQEELHHDYVHNIVGSFQHPKCSVNHITLDEILNAAKPEVPQLDEFTVEFEKFPDSPFIVDDMPRPFNGFDIVDATYLLRTVLQVIYGWVTNSWHTYEIG